MRILLASILVLALALTVCAGDREDPYSQPDWGYAFDDPHYIPDSAPQALRDFHDQMIPMMEARKSAESAYLREYADALYVASKKVAGSLESDSKYQRMHYNRAARDLRKHCRKLRETAFGGQSEALYAQMKVIEADYVRLANLSEPL